MIRIHRNIDSVILKWDDDYEACFRVRWGIVAKLGADSTPTCTGSKTSDYNLIIRWAIDTSDVNGDRGSYDPAIIIGLEQYHSRDSYISWMYAELHTVLVRLGREDVELEKQIIKMCGPLFDMLDIKLNNTLVNIDLVTQIFEQCVYMSNSVYEQLENELTWDTKSSRSAKGGK